MIEQFKGDKQLVFKFKKRKNYKRLRGHRQQLTRVQIDSVGTKAPEEGQEACRRRSPSDPRRRRRISKEGQQWHTKRVSVPAVTAATPTRSDWA